MDEKYLSDPILRDVWAYCSDPIFIRSELNIARSKEDSAGYLERRIEEEEGSRKADLRILLNRFTKMIYQSSTA